MMKSQNKNFTQSVISTLFTKFILIFLKMGVGIITARFLGPAGRGLFYTSVQAPGLINTVGTLSIGEGLIYHIGKGKIKSDQIFGTVFMMVLGFTLVLSIIFYSSNIINSIGDSLHCCRSHCRFMSFVVVCPFS
jgi:O-antigen/teichoic acid export membrane protein